MRRFPLFKLITLDTFTKKRFWSDTLLLQKTLPQNPPDLKIQKIVISSTSYQNPRPILDLEIYNDGNCFYKGWQNTQLDGYYEGSMDTTLFQFYEQKIRNVPLSIFRQNTQTKHNDEWKAYLVIYLEGGEKLKRSLQEPTKLLNNSFKKMMHLFGNETGYL